MTPDATRRLLEACRNHYRPSCTRAAQIKAAIDHTRTSLLLQMLETERQQRTRQAQGGDHDQ